MKLFGHPDSGHAFKVKFFMDWLKVDYQYEWVDIFSEAESRNPEFLSASKFSEVPTLIDAGQSYTQSNAILMYLADKFQVFNSEQDRQACLEWLMWEANKIGMCLPQLRAHKKFSGFKLSQGAFDWLINRYENDISTLNTSLSDGRLFIMGDQVSPADFSLSGYLMYADEADIQVPNKVSDWINRLCQLNGWQPPVLLLKDPLSL